MGLPWETLGYAGGARAPQSACFSDGPDVSTFHLISQFCGLSPDTVGFRLFGSCLDFGLSGPSAMVDTRPADDDH
jgi:hypothetical protein